MFIISSERLSRNHIRVREGVRECIQEPKAWPASPVTAMTLRTMNQLQNAKSGTYRLSRNRFLFRGVEGGEAVKICVEVDLAIIFIDKLRSSTFLRTKGNGCGEMMIAFFFFFYLATIVFLFLIRFDIKVLSYF